MTSGGTVSTLTLPTGVTLDTTLIPRFVVFGRQVLLTNTGTVNLWIDPSDDTVRPMVLKRPAVPPLLAVGGTGSLTGVYKAKAAFGVKDDNGVVLSLSPLSTESASVTLTSDLLRATNVPISEDS